MWVYFTAPHNADYCKVGITSKNPYARIAALQTGHPSKLQLHAAFEFEEKESAEYVEREFLRRWEACYGLYGEWIGLNVAILLSCFADVCKNTEDGNPLPRQHKPVAFMGIGLKWRGPHPHDDHSDETMAKFYATA